MAKAKFEVAKAFALFMLPTIKNGNLDVEAANDIYKTVAQSYKLHEIDFVEFANNFLKDCEKFADVRRAVELYAETLAVESIR